MAKKKPKRVKCLGYTLSVTNDPDDGRNLALIIKGEDEKEYELRVDLPDDRPDLVKDMFKVLVVWPARTFFFTVDGDDEITGFSRT